MFFYLLQNSSIIKNQKNIHKHISTLIYGSLIYIIIHAFFSCKKDNIFFNNLTKYFWIIFILDCIAVSFTFIMNDNGSLVFDNTLKFNVNAKNSFKEIKKDIDDLKIKKKIKLDETQLKIKKKIINNEENLENSSDHNFKNLPNIEEVPLATNKSIDLITKKTMNKINLTLDKPVYSAGSDSDSINDSELGSDLDDFEKSLQQEFSVKP